MSKVVEAVSGAARVSLDAAVEQVVAATGGVIRLGLPLGLGKPNQFVNALCEYVGKHPQYSLEIYTALSLGRPRAGSGLEQRFLAPFLDRVYGDYVELGYRSAEMKRALPANIKVYEFFFQPASMLGNGPAQQHYISCNYTHAARDLNARGVNVVAQMVARDPARPGKLSLSCNPEVTLDLEPLLRQRRARGDVILAVAQVHDELPYMLNDAEVDEQFFDLVIDQEGLSTRLFSTPNMPVNQQDHFVGLHASSLIADGGLLQIGIGALGDALVHHTLMRHHENQDYRKLLAEAGALASFGNDIERIGGTAPFDRGLYGCSEMVTAGLLGLVDGGVIRRAVAADPDLQQLLECGRIGEQISLQTLDVLIEEGVLSPRLTRKQLAWLADQGILTEAISLRDKRLEFVDGSSVVNDLEDRVVREAIRQRLAATLRTTLLHGGFFLGPAAFYRRLRAMSEAERERINMTRISYVNDLLGDERLKRAQRQHARFVNTVFSATLMGAGISDQLESGQVLSGVGGQYNFVAQAHELAGARSILMLRAWRERGGEASSNLLWNYGHTTIPRHLRDVFVTEYGVADLRGKSDSECIAAMLNIADSRFQQGLLESARQAGKISAGYSIPERYRHNTPQRLEQIYQQYRDAMPQFPLGTDFDPVERRLLSALGWLKEKMSAKRYFQLGRSALGDDVDAQQYAVHLQRMGLEQADGLKQKLYRRLLLSALAQTAADGVRKNS